VPIPPAVMRASYALKRVGGSFFLRSQSSVCHQIIRMFGLPDGFHLETFVYKDYIPNVKSSAPKSRTGKRS